MSFGLIRGGQVDVTVLGGLQIDAEGHLANWMIPSKLVPGMRGAMDLLSGGAKRVIVAMQHAAKGKSKVVQKMRFAADLLAAGRCRSGRYRHGGDRLFEWKITLQDTAPGVSVAEVVAVTGADLFVPADVPQMKI
jgi:acetate CoA/acetoacetate CoA-transferase beta subunit